MNFKTVLGLMLMAFEAIALIGWTTGNALAAVPSERLIYSFQGTNLDGESPSGGLISDPNGDLYGTTSNGGAYGLGTVYKLTPPREGRGSWTETVLYDFQGDSSGDGALPLSAMLMDDRGNLFGTTFAGGDQLNCPDCGTVFMLTRPTGRGGEWTESVIYSFSGLDGAYPAAALTMDGKGNLYGTTLLGGPSLFGAVFELSPNRRGSWSEQVLYSFTGGADGAEPVAAVIHDAKGMLYGTTSTGGASDFGTVFELSKPKSSSVWSEKVLYSFTGGGDGAEPDGGVILDGMGRLDGSTTYGGSANCAGGCGTIYQLAPPSVSGGAWTIQTLYGFTGGSDGSGPFAGVTRDGGGRLLGVANLGGMSDTDCSGGCGTIFRLTSSGSTHTTWNESTIYQFAGGSDDGAYPAARLLLTDDGGTFGVTQGGGTYGVGTVFQIPGH